MPNRLCIKWWIRKKESYIQNEEQMRNYILDSGVGKVKLVMADGKQFPVTGNKLSALIKKGYAHGRYTGSF